MSPPILVRFFIPEAGPRLGVRLDDTIHDVTGPVGTAASWLQDSAGRVEAAIADLVAAAGATAFRYPATLFENPPLPGRPHWLAPVDEQDVWAAGVTYERSRAARQQEAVDGGDVYARVYAAERPEIFFKARGPWVIGPYGEVGIREDARWSVPEPELGLVINPALEIAGVVAGNDLSSRDIEGENPLYLPQAKIYSASCALGPGLVLGPVSNNWPQVAIRLAIWRQGKNIFSGETHTRRLRRRPDELVAYLGRALDFPDGVVLLSGTGVVPPDDFSLAPGDVVRIAIDGLGQLENTVKVV